MTEIPHFTGRHVLYRLLNADECLLYVGITHNVGRRFGDHAKVQHWWPQVADCRVEFFPDRPALEEAEKSAIRQGRPRYNFTHNRESRAEQTRRRTERQSFTNLTGEEWTESAVERTAILARRISEWEDEHWQARRLRDADLRALAAEHGPAKAARLAKVSLSTVKLAVGRP